MRRVATRPRVTACDHFKATVTDSDTDSVVDSHHESDISWEEEQELTLKRKREAQQKQEKEDKDWGSMVVRDVSAEPKSTLFKLQYGSEPKRKHQSMIESLSDDLQLSILEYCDTTSVRKMMQVNHHYRDLMASEEAKTLWWEACHRQWKWLSDDAGDVVDDLHVPIPAVASPATEERVNLAVLLSMAAEHKSSSIDQSLIGPPFNPRYHFRPRFWSASGAGNDGMLQLKMLDLPNVGTAVQFTGIVGQGDRCVRADQPLPRPSLLTQAQRREARSLTKGRSLFYRISHLKYHRVPRLERPVWRPFVAPFVGHCPANHKRRVMHVTPRLISYFEVTILEKPKEEQKSTAGTSGNRVRENITTLNRFEEPVNPEPVLECIAVGLATDRFCLNARMPGWDNQSYGYHGDDGGIYHAEGHMVRNYGPRFGAGDTIGCGLDYQHRAIFFTRNGAFLGYAFEDISLTELQSDWFPVVGMDSNCPVTCNFGCERPFAFDLTHMIEKQGDVVLHSMMIATTPSSSHHDHHHHHNDDHRHKHGLLKKLLCKI